MNSDLMDSRSMFWATMWHYTWLRFFSAHSHRPTPRAFDSYSFNRLSVSEKFVRLTLQSLLGKGPKRKGTFVPTLPETGGKGNRLWSKILSIGHSRQQNPERQSVEILLIALLKTTLFKEEELLICSSHQTMERPEVDWPQGSLHPSTRIPLNALAVSSVSLCQLVFCSQPIATGQEE